MVNSTFTSVMKHNHILLKLKDERVAEEFVNRPSGDLEDLGVLGNPEELWSAFKTTILDVAGGCLATHHQANKNLSPKGHWIPLTRVAGPGLMAKLSCSGS